jgi:hypothetical protein
MSRAITDSTYIPIRGAEHVINNDAIAHIETSSSGHLDVRLYSNADDHDVGRHTLVLDCLNSNDGICLGHDMQNLRIEHEAHAISGVLSGENRRDLRAQRPGHRTIGDFDHGDSDTLLRCGGGELETDKSRSNDHGISSSCERSLQRTSLVQCPKVMRAA